MAGKSFKSGDKVSWSGGGTSTEGAVEKKITGTTKIKGHTAKATKDDPQYVVKSSKTGAKAAHKPDELKRR